MHLVESSNLGTWNVILTYVKGALGKKLENYWTVTSVNCAAMLPTLKTTAF